GPVLLRIADGSSWHAALDALRTTRVAVAGVGVAERSRAWRDAVSRAAPRADLADRAALALADRFDLTPASIARIVRRAADEGAFDDAADAPSNSSILAGRLSEAARDDLRDAIGTLAVRAPTPHAWDDLVLPAPTLARLRDFSAAVRDRAIVLD